MLKYCFKNTEGMISFEEGVSLYFFAKKVKEGCVMEVGTYRGRATVFLGKGSINGFNVPVYAVDPHKEFIGVLGGVFGPKDRTAFYKAMLVNEVSETISLINLSSENFSSTWQEPISLLWIDGDHSYEGVKRDFNCWIEHCISNAVIAFDDAIDINLGPRKLINELTLSGVFKEIANVGKIAFLKKTDKAKFKELI